jgi:L,D-transpeptidase ErfK/SrfK
VVRGIAAFLVAGALAAGCGGLRWRGHAAPTAGLADADFARKPVATYRIATRAAAGASTDTVIGSARRYRIRRGDTLLDVARWYDLGYNEIVDANPGVDPMIPPVGADVLVPTEWVLPCCARDGIVVNIPEMRLFYFRPDPDDPGRTVVQTYPVGLGRDDRRTPRGRFRVVTKTVDPAWHVPESIRREHIRERGDPRRVIPGGDPDNPLGKYRLQLSRRLYGIHGTDTPWGVGMQVTHGCVRLYPEDIERLYPLVPVGTPVEFTYQPVKVGTRGGTVYVEVHRDIYRYAGSLASATRAALARQSVVERVDPHLVAGAIAGAAGVPVPVSRSRAPATTAVPATAGRPAG